MTARASIEEVLESNPLASGRGVPGGHQIVEVHPVDAYFLKAVKRLTPSFLDDSISAVLYQQRSIHSQE
jgi:hypothetical protein